MMNLYTNLISLTNNLTLLIACLVFLIACNNPEAEIASSTPTDASLEENTIAISQKQYTSAKLKLAQLEERPFSTTIAVNGQLDVPPEFRAAVSAYFGGYVKDISILPGQFIKKEGTLFTMENPLFLQMQEEYLAISGELAYLKNDFQRQENLYADKVSSEKEFLKAKAAYQAAAAKKAALAKQLSMININVAKISTENLKSVVTVKSPIGGYVHKVNAEKGMYLKPETMAVALINTDHIHIELNVYEKDYSQLGIGQEIQFQLQNNSNKSYAAEIFLISRALEDENRIIRVHGHLKNKHEHTNFLPGMYVEAKISTSTSNQFALPESSVVNIDNSYYVLALEKQADSTYYFKREKVEIGATDGGFTKIINARNFKADTKFLSKGAFNLISD
jgi:cobalt-zinc-cadmium efflux system membrane fusion protein